MIGFPTKPTYFFDVNCSPRIVELVSSLGSDVVGHREQFAPDCPDIDWIPEAGQKGWILVSADDRIRTQAVTRQALKAYNLRMISLPKSFTTWRAIQQLEWIRQRWQSIRQFAETEQGWFAVRYGKSGTITSSER